MTAAIATLFAGAPSSSFAAELRISCGVNPYENVFAKVEAGFEKKTGIKIVYVTRRVETGVDKSLQALFERRADIASAAVDWDEWQKLAAEKKVGTPAEMAAVTFRVVGRDEVKIIAAPGTGVTKLSAEQARRVFNGDAKNWKDVGGNDLPIQILLQSTYPGTNASFRKAVLRSENFSPSARTVGSFTQLLVELAKNPGAFSFLSRVTPTPGLDTIEGSVFLRRPITALTLGKPSPEAQSLIQYIHDNPP